MKLMNLIFFMAVVWVIIFSGCIERVPPTFCEVTDPLYCKNDSDCICTEDAGCFLGNKYYYKKCVNKSEVCFDYCTGWGQPPVKCINNQCTNSYKIEEVTITTDKTEYEQGEIVKIIVKNNLDKSIWYLSDWPSWWNLEKQVNKDWKQIDLFPPISTEGREECVQPLPPQSIEEVLKELKPNFEIEDNWNLRNCELEIGVSISIDFIDSGNYRLSFTYGFGQDNYTEKTIYSNEFTIKEKSGVRITTDKTEYEQGEIVKITVKNNLDKSIWYNRETCPPFCYALQKLENGEWKNVNIAMEIVLDLPVKASFLKSNEEVNREWNMLIVKPVDQIIMANSGKYRFYFDYGLSKDNFAEKTVYSNEFTIKEKPKG